MHAHVTFTECMFTNISVYFYHVTASPEFNHEITVRAQMEVCDVCCYSSTEFLCYDCSSEGKPLCGNCSELYNILH